jgi:DNA-binding SARP family transcriptional activator/predicted ATPase
MPRLSLALLGPFHATLDGASLTSFESNKVRALLAYLAVEADRPHPRDVLAGLLWPHRPNQDALSNLRYALYDLRNVLRDRQADPAFLIITRRALQFNSASNHSFDVATFQDHVAGLPLDSGTEAEGAIAGRPQQFRDLQATLALYRGHFMRGFSLDDSPGFEEWVLFKREQIDRQMIAALRILAHYRERQGNTEQARRAVQRLLELEPWDEGAHRHLMRLLMLEGRRNAALSQYQACRSTLAAELDVEPTAATTALYERIRRGETVRVGVRGATRAPRQAAPRSIHFVGREHELERLEQFLGSALAGQGRVAFVTGEAGSGKTSLIHAFASQALRAHSDLVVTVGACSAHGSIGDPYLPFSETLELLAGDIEAKRAGGAVTREHAERLWHALPLFARALVDEGPDLVDRLVAGRPLLLRLEAFVPHGASLSARLECLMQREGAQKASQPAPSQSGLFEQVTRVLLTLAESHPLLLLLDDLQWVDPGSASLLFHLGRRLARSRILVVGAYRPCGVGPAEDGERHPVSAVVHELARELGPAEVCLDRADGRRFVDAFLDSEPNCLGESFREALFRHTDGNALFVTEFLRDLQGRGDLVQDEQGRWSEGATLDWEEVPARVEAVVAERIEMLPQAWQEMLRTASVEGETFTAEVVARVQGLDDGKIIRCLSGPMSKQQRLVTAESVRRVDDRRLSSYRFRHILFRNYLYQSLDEVERAPLHEAVGRELEALYGERAAEISGQLARHFEAAEMTPQALKYLLRAGKRAVLLSANEEAVALFTRGLELLETLPETPARDRQEFALRLALYAPLTAMQGYACPELEDSNACAHELSLRLGEGEELIPALILLAGFYSFRAEFRTAIDLAQRALALAERSELPGHIVWAAQVVGMTLVYQGDFVTARKHLELTLTVDDVDHEAMVPVRGRDPRVAYRSFAAWVAWFLGYPDQAQQLGREALNLAQEASHPPSLAMALYVGRVVPQMLRREYEAIPRLVEAFTQLTADHRLGLSEPGVRLARGRALVHRGQAQAGIREMQQGLAAWQATGTKAWASVYLGILADAYLEAGQLEQAQNALDEAFTVVRESGERIVEAELHRLQGEVRLARGEEDEAEAYFRRAVAVARLQEARSWELRAKMSLARLLGQRGRKEEARCMLRDIYGWFTEGFDTSDLKEARALLDGLSE